MVTETERVNGFWERGIQNKSGNNSNNNNNNNNNNNIIIINK